MYLHRAKNGHYTPPCCYFSGELEVVEILRFGFCCKQLRESNVMMRFVYLIRLQLVLNKQMHSVIYRGSKKKLLQKSIMRDMIT